MTLRNIKTCTSGSCDRRDGSEKGDVPEQAGTGCEPIQSGNRLRPAPAEDTGGANRKRGAQDFERLRICAPDVTHLSNRGWDDRGQQGRKSRAFPPRRAGPQTGERRNSLGSPTACHSTRFGDTRSLSAISTRQATRETNGSEPLVQSLRDRPLSRLISVPIDRSHSRRAKSRPGVPVRLPVPPPAETAKSPRGLKATDQTHSL